MRHNRTIAVFERNKIGAAHDVPTPYSDSSACIDFIVAWRILILSMHSGVS